MKPINDLECLYLERGAARYEINGRDGVSQLQHALQCAAQAVVAGAADTLVGAALLHDLGHLLNEHHSDELGAGRDEVHQYLALPFLRAHFAPALVDPIKLHVDAKRYLCATEADYWSRLSAGSRHSLALQGGPFSAAEALDFSRLEFAAEAVQLRRWDDQAKDLAREVPAFTEYRGLLSGLLIRPILPVRPA
jgi:phosphonate degradation associated HDIG domain protein